MRPLRIWIVASLLVLVVGACGDDSTDGRVTTSPVGSDADALAGTSWVAQRIANGSGERDALAGKEPTVDFGADGSTISGSTGCNLYSGNVTISGGTISVAQVSVTERVCIPREIMEQEALFLEIVTSADEVTLAGGVLELKSTEGSVSFIEPTQVVDVPLDETTWVLDSLIDGEVAMSVLATTTPSLTVDTGEGSMQGTTGCNNFGGAVTIEGNGFTVTDMESTVIGCELEIMRQETFIVDVLQNAKSFEIDGDRLTISSIEKRYLIYRSG